jgi:hypothetical protein
MNQSTCEVCDSPLTRVGLACKRCGHKPPHPIAKRFRWAIFLLLFSCWIFDWGNLSAFYDNVNKEDNGEQHYNPDTKGYDLSQYKVEEIARKSMVRIEVLFEDQDYFSIEKGHVVGAGTITQCDDEGITIFTTKNALGFEKMTKLDLDGEPELVAYSVSITLPNGEERVPDKLSVYSTSELCVLTVTGSLSDSCEPVAVTPDTQKLKNEAVYVFEYDSELDLAEPGRLTDVSKEQSHPDNAPPIIFHNVKFDDRAIGGPLMNSSGKCLGINSRLSPEQPCAYRYYGPDQNLGQLDEVSMSIEGIQNWVNLNRSL